MEQIKKWDDFLEVVRKTRFAPVFLDYAKKEDTIDLFQIENKLDRFYFENMIRTAKQYNASLTDMLGKQIDLNNIVWIYRMKKQGEFSPEQIREILIHAHDKLSKIEMEKLLQASNENEFCGILKQTFYAKYVNFSELGGLEEKIDRYLYHLYQKYFRNNIFDIGAVYAYMSMIEKENNDIMNIVEGIRYHLSKDEIRQKLI